MNMFLFYRYLWALVFAAFATTWFEEYSSDILQWRHTSFMTQTTGNSNSLLNILFHATTKEASKLSPFEWKCTSHRWSPHKGPEMRGIPDAIVFTFTSFNRSTLASGPSNARIKAVITATMIVICVPRGVIIGVPWTCRQFRAPLCVIDRSYSLYISMTPCEVAQIKCQCWHLVHS